MAAFAVATGATVVAAVLFVTGAHHLAAPSGLRTALVRHGVVPPGAVGAVHVLVTVVELGTAAAATVALVQGGTGVTLAAMGAATALATALATYVRLAATRAPSAPCGCSPLPWPITSPAALVPAAGLASAGALGALGALASSPVQPLGGLPGLGAAAALPVVVGVTLAVLVLLLPAAASPPAAIEGR